jgi:hypothetical protein
MCVGWLCWSIDKEDDSFSEEFVVKSCLFDVQARCEWHLSPAQEGAISSAVFLGVFL